MGIIEDLLNALDRIPIWKRLQELPPEVERLKHRVAELEEKLGDVWPPDVCRLCGKRAARIVNSFTSEKGLIGEEFYCEECKGRDMRYRKP